MDMDIMFSGYPSCESNISGMPFLESDDIWYKCPFGLQDELIQIWLWSHCDLTKPIFGHDSKSQVLNIVTFTQMSDSELTTLVLPAHLQTGYCIDLKFCRIEDVCEASTF